MKSLFKNKAVRLFCVTFIIHCAVVVLLSFVSISLTSNGGDNFLYHDLGSQIAQLLHAGTYHLNDVYSHHWFPLFVGGVYFITGPSMLLISLINALLVGITAVLGYLLLKGNNVSEKFSWWGIFIMMNGYSSLMYHSSILLKEAWVLVLVFGILYSVHFIIRSKSYKKQLVLFIGILVLFLLLRNLRLFIGFASITGFFIDWFFNAERSLKIRLGMGIVMLVIVNSFVIILWGDGIMRDVGIVGYFNFGKIEQVRKTYSEGGSTTTNIQLIKNTYYPEESGVSVKHSFSIKGFIESFLNVFASPFPWQLPLSQYVVIIPDILFVYTVIIITIVGYIKSSWSDRKKVIGWTVTASVILLGLIMGSDNLGAIIRQRIVFVVLLGMIAIFYLESLINTYIDIDKSKALK